jgi:hypothetical protein
VVDVKMAGLELTSEWDGFLKAMRKEFEGLEERYRKKGKYFKKHEYLKMVAGQLLKLMGCEKVEFEYPVRYTSMDYLRRIDVVGFRGEEEIAVECGNDHRAEGIISLVEELGFDEGFLLRYSFRLWRCRRAT